MKLPGLENAVIQKNKVTEYMLSQEHWTGRGKAAFFLRFGFQRERWRELADALVAHAASNDVDHVEKTVFGDKYIIEGGMETPSGRSPVVRAVWFIEKGESSPRFVTAYPLERGKDI